MAVICTLGLAATCECYRRLSRRRIITRPHHAADPVQVAHGYRRPMPLHWGQALATLVSSCWAQDPDYRPSAREVTLTLILTRGPQASQGSPVPMPRVRPPIVHGTGLVNT